MEINKIKQAILQDTNELKKLLKKDKINLNPDKHLNSFIPLFFAIINDKPKSVLLLLQYGTDINIKDNFEETGLMVALKLNNIYIIRLLLECGANINIQNKYGYTALMYSLIYNNITIIKLLIDYKCDLNILNKYNENALNIYLKTPDSLESIDCSVYLSSETLDETIKYKKIKLLIESGIDINNISVDGKNILMKLLSDNTNINIKIITLLLDNGIKVDTKDVLDNSAIMFAIKNKQLEIVKLLIEKGADINITDYYQKTPLMLACQVEDENIIELLLSNGSDINFQNNYGNTCLMRTCSKGSLNIIKLLVENKANINIKNLFNRTALNFAITLKNTEVVEYLIKNGANINHICNTGNSILIEAVQHGLYEIVYLLLDNDVDTDIINKEQKTALDIAYENNDLRIIPVLSSDEEMINRLTFIDKNTKCDICLEDYSFEKDSIKSLVIQCGHIFHKSCINLLYNHCYNSWKCPKCRMLVIDILPLNTVNLFFYNKKITRL
jgi:ankyrin repeat protein